MFCSKCGKANDQDANFCKDCGQVLKLATGTFFSDVSNADSQLSSSQKRKFTPVWISGLVVVVALLVFGSIMNTQSGGNSINDDASSTQVEPDPVVDNSWIPSGFTVYSGDSDVAWDWVDKSCGAASFNGCYHMKVVTNKVCASSLYVELNELDSSKNVLGMTNASLGHLDSGRIAVLEFSAIRDGAKSAELAKILCF